MNEVLNELLNEALKQSDYKKLLPIIKYLGTHDEITPETAMHLTGKCMALSAEIV